MRIQINKGTLSRKHRLDGQDIGSTTLFPGEYAGSLGSTGDLEINISDGEYAYLSFDLVEERVWLGDIVVLAV